MKETKTIHVGSIDPTTGDKHKMVMTLGTKGLTKGDLRTLKQWLRMYHTHAVDRDLVHRCVRSRPENALTVDGVSVYCIAVLRPDEKAALEALADFKAQLADIARRSSADRPETAAETSESPATSTHAWHGDLEGPLIELDDP